MLELGEAPGLEGNLGAWKSGGDPGAAPLRGQAARRAEKPPSPGQEGQQNPASGCRPEWQSGSLEPPRSSGQGPSHFPGTCLDQTPKTTFTEEQSTDDIEEASVCPQLGFAALYLFSK